MLKTIMNALLIMTFLLAIAGCDKIKSITGGGKSQSSAKTVSAEDAAKAESLRKEGFQLYKQKKDKEAVKKYEEALKIDETAEIYYNYANSLSNIPKLAESVKAYERAVELHHPELQNVYYNMACAYSRMKKADKGFEYLKLAADFGYKKFANFEKDKDLEFLRGQSDWSERLEAIKNPKLKDPVTKPGGSANEQEVLGAYHVENPNTEYDVKLCAGGRYYSFAPDTNYKVFGTFMLDNGLIKVRPQKTCMSMGEMKCEDRTDLKVTFLDYEMTAAEMAQLVKKRKISFDEGTVKVQFKPGADLKCDE